MFDKITARIRKLCYGFDPKLVDPAVITMKVIQGVYDGVTTAALDDLAAETAAYMTTQHPDYSRLAARIAVSNLHKMTEKSFSATMGALHSYINPRNGQPAPLISDEVYKIIVENKDRLEAAIVFDRDFDYDFFGFKTLEKSYLLRMHGKVVERPQHMLMRVSVGIHKEDLDAAIETFNLMSQKWFTHATPTMFNAGTPCPQMSSCFLLSMKEARAEPPIFCFLLLLVSTLHTSVAFSVAFSVASSVAARFHIAHTRPCWAHTSYAHAFPTRHASMPHPIRFPPITYHEIRFLSFSSPHASSCWFPVGSLTPLRFLLVYNPVGSLTRRTRSMASLRRSSSARKSRNLRVGSVSPSRTCVRPARTSKGAAAPPTASRPCCASSTTRRGTWTRAAASARVRSPCTTSRGTRTSLSSSTSRRTTARRSLELATSSTRSGCPISS